MIKGCAKRVVVVKNVDSSLFEEAFFIVRAGTSTKKCGETELMCEASRLVKTGEMTAEENGENSFDMPEAPPLCELKAPEKGVKIAFNKKNPPKKGKYAHVLHDVLIFSAGVLAGIIIFIL